MRQGLFILACLLAGGADASALDLDLAKIAPTMEACPGRPGFVRMPGARHCTRLSGRVAAGLDARTGAGGTATRDSDSHSRPEHDDWRRLCNSSP